MANRFDNYMRAVTLWDTYVKEKEQIGLASHKNFSDALRVSHYPPTLPTHNRQFFSTFAKTLTDVYLPEIEALVNTYSVSAGLSVVLAMDVSDGNVTMQPTMCTKQEDQWQYISAVPTSQATTSVEVVWFISRPDTMPINLTTEVHPCKATQK